jgi:hypothetical protein
LRAINRGWAARNWRKQPADPLQMISINIQPTPPKPAGTDERLVEELAVEVQQHLVLDDENSSQIRVDAGQQVEVKETKPAKPRRVKVREIKQEAQTGKLISVYCGQD